MRQDVFKRLGVAGGAGCAALVIAGGLTAHPAGEARGLAFGPWSAPVHLGPIVNSSATDAGPAISRDGLSLYFHSPRLAGVNLPDIYVARRAGRDLPWQAPVNVGPPVNSGTADAAPILSRNGHFLFFARVHAGTFDIFVSRRRHVHDDFAWETPVPLSSPVNGTGFDVPSDYVEGRGRATLYFASDRANGLGAPGLDIYMSELETNGNWSEPVYLDELNSPFRDDRPTVRFDGLELIFGSARERNGLDLYVSRRSSRWEPWSEPENLGPVLNSSAGDIHPALSADGRTLYFASARPGGAGGFDLYAATRSRLRPNDDDDHDD